MGAREPDEDDRLAQAIVMQMVEDSDLEDFPSWAPQAETLVLLEAPFY